MSRATPTLSASRLDRMLQDPLIRLVMASDRVEEADIRRLADRVAARPSPLTFRPIGARDCAGWA